ncbi:MAG: hypothetical protein CMM87_00475 [Rickettsiales bacterium]|nr:hypothetical protein [Rickettsiales bacterium]|tara:strand:+ start:90539 stop:91273 length:735 start_codon:yes stop_codon:yes gene_type:complete
MKKLNLFFAGAAALSATSAFAFESGPYLHLIGAISKVETTNDVGVIDAGNNDSLARYTIKANKSYVEPRLAAGWYLLSDKSPWIVAPELFYALGNAKQSGTETRNGVPDNFRQTVEMKFKHAYGLNVRVGYKCREDLAVFGKVGYQKEQYDFKSTAINDVNQAQQVTSSKVKPNVFVLGLGADYFLGEAQNWVLRGEVSRMVRLNAKKPVNQRLALQNFANARFDTTQKVNSSWAVSVGVGYKF